MAKQKKKASVAKNQPALSNKNYILQDKARKLTISKCLINKEWQEDGLAGIYVMRKHSNGNVTVGMYLVDLLCAGLKDTLYIFNQYEAFLDFELSQLPLELVECSYELAHNIIYGGIAYAEEYGIAPHPDFHVTRHLLEEDTEDISLVELEFGKNGKPFLLLKPDDPRGYYYQRQLQSHAAPGEYEMVVGPDLDYVSDDEEDHYAHPEAWGLKDWKEFIDQTETEKLILFPEVAMLVYEKVSVKPTQAMKLQLGDNQHHEMIISYDMTNELLFAYTASELKEMNRIRKAIDSPKFEDEDFEEIVKQLKNNMAKYPHNPTFHSLLVNAYDRHQDEESSEKAIEELYAKFPDYLFAKTLYAELLLDRQETDKVPEVFGGEYTLATIYPHRKTFHVSELIQFNTVMCWYFLEKEDVHTAYLYGKMLLQLDNELLNELTHTILILLNTAISNEVKPLLKKARKNNPYKEELLTQLLH